MKFSKWTIAFLLLCLSLNACAEGQLFGSGGLLEEANPLETTITYRQATDPETGEALFDENGAPVLDEIEQTEIKPVIRNVVKSFGPWGELAVALGGTLLGFFTLKSRRAEKAAKTEAESNKAAALALMRAGRSSDTTPQLKGELAALPYNDPARSRIRDLAPLA